MSDHRPLTIFIADALGLDFLNSVATPAGTQVDWITDGEGLMAWLDQAELVLTEVLERLRAEVMPGRWTMSPPRREPFGNGSGVRRCAEGAVRPVRGRPRSGAAESTARTR